MEKERRPWLFPPQRKKRLGNSKQMKRSDRVRQERMPGLDRLDGDSLEDAYYAGLQAGFREGYNEGYDDGYDDARHNRKYIRKDHPEKLRWHGRRSLSWFWL
jgi:hypothetical protein